MTQESYRSAEQFGDALRALSDRLLATAYDDLPPRVRERLELALVDLVGVSISGMRTPELGAFVATADPPAGPHRLLGTTRLAGPVDSAWFPAVAASWLELDEGNKHAVGHPATHVFFTALAASRSLSSPVCGARFLMAVAGGYELAARVGGSLRRDPRWHTHGHWGVLGSAWTAAYLLGCDPSACASAVGAAGSLMRVAPWQSVLEGDVTRNLWMADAVPAGLRAAQLAAAGLAPPPSSAAHGLALVGECSPSALGARAERWLCGEGYLKLHSACSYTHPAIDLVVALRGELPDATRVTVRTNSLAGPLADRRAVDNRLAAMFSLPFVVATAWAHGEVTPAVMDPDSSAFARSRALLDRVEVVVDETLDTWLPDRRVTEVTLTDGARTVALASPNPVGDSDHFPLGRAQVRGKLERLLGADEVDAVWATMAALPSTPDVVGTFAGL
jgi:2-methylcitrate dehydratase PrpD